MQSQYLPAPVLHFGQIPLRADVGKQQILILLVPP